MIIDLGLSRSIQKAHAGDGVYRRLQYLPPEVFGRPIIYNALERILFWNSHIAVRREDVISRNSHRCNPRANGRVVRGHHTGRTRRIHGTPGSVLESMLGRKAFGTRRAQSPTGPGSVRVAATRT
ncbi:hypothetical protein BC936DRAFT_136992 [Jimgerdemannia flammicorona]|uniref:Protein kinase domain-containing protein n=1 Tax=Jimgerdemannia flammicorona TaxID=994334 RepID=A0A433DJ97_9FUNG|nr:hypothetical protein BC936DRAFT_136992 [Jimgerdemannia flammicorona]